MEDISTSPEHKLSQMNCLIDVYSELCKKLHSRQYAFENLCKYSAGDKSSVSEEALNVIEKGVSEHLSHPEFAKTLGEFIERFSIYQPEIHCLTFSRS